MDSVSVDQANEMRKVLGLPLLATPGSAATAPEDDGDDSSTLEKREGAASKNFEKLQKEKEVTEARRKRLEQIERARELAQRAARVEGKGIAQLESGDKDAKSWLKGLAKKNKAVKAEQEEIKKTTLAATEEAGDVQVAVGHDIGDLVDGEHVLTLKDRGVLDEESNEELENVEIREREELEERLKLKRKRPVYDPLADDNESILAQYDDPKSRKKVKLGIGVNLTDGLADILESAPVRGGDEEKKRQMLDLDVLDDRNPVISSDYLDPSQIKMKKPKSSKKKSRRQRAVDEDSLFDATIALPESMEVDPPKKQKVIREEDYVDDEDLQTALAASRQRALKARNRSKPEDIARQLKEEENNSEQENGGTGLVLDDIRGFVDALQGRDEEERKSRKKSGTAVITAMEDDSDNEMHDATAEDAVDRDTPQDRTATGVEDEKMISETMGLGATLSLLRDRGVVSRDMQTSADKIKQLQQSEKFKAELKRAMAEFDEKARQQRETDRQTGKYDHMSVREREEWQRQQNHQREIHQSRTLDRLYREAYKPNFELRYIDADGRKLESPREAFKELSHAFHGKGSGKGKTDKRLKRIADEKRRMAESLLDSSQNVGMSTAASHQGKKRKEAGVRLQ